MAVLFDIFFSINPFIIPLKPINPVKEIAIMSRSINTNVIPAVNIVIRLKTPKKNINIYAGICINFTIIFIRNIFFDSLVDLMFMINITTEQVDAIMNITININNKKSALP
jgi:hypothetical protein